MRAFAWLYITFHLPAYLNHSISRQIGIIITWACHHYFNQLSMSFHTAFRWHAHWFDCLNRFRDYKLTISSDLKGIKAYENWKLTTAASMIIFHETDWWCSNIDDALAQCNNADEPDCENYFEADEVLGTSYIDCTGCPPACVEISVSRRSLAFSIWSS